MSVPRENLMQIEPYLSFDGNCEEALQFYRQCLGGEIVALHRYEGSPMDTPQLPAEWKKRVMHATFEADGHRLMASDRMPGQQEERYAGFSLSINIPKDSARARQVFDALAEGGRVTMPFAHTFWGADFGMLVDRFGVPWMVNCDAGQ